jgi:hypothetical protein
MLSEDDLDKLTVIIAVAGLALGFIFIWAATALVNGSVITAVIACLVLALVLGTVVGKAAHHEGEQPMTSQPPADIVERLQAMALRLELAAGKFPRRQIADLLRDAASEIRNLRHLNDVATAANQDIAAIARDAAHELTSLRRLVEELQARLDELQRDGHRC